MSEEIKDAENENAKKSDCKTLLFLEKKKQKPEITQASSSSGS